MLYARLHVPFNFNTHRFVNYYNVYCSNHAVYLKRTNVNKNETTLKYVYVYARIGTHKHLCIMFRNRDYKFFIKYKNSKFQKK